MYFPKHRFLKFLWFRVSFMESLKFRDSLKFGDFIPKFATLKLRVFFSQKIPKFESLKFRDFSLNLRV